VTAWVVDLLGVGVAVTVEADHLAAPLGRALADLVVSTGTGAPAVDHEIRLAGPDAHGRCTLRDRSAVIAADVDEDLAAAWLLWYLNRLAATTPHRVTIHAGAVAAPSGAVILPGPPGAGKSTMTAALVRAGCGYLSDELAALDLAGEAVHPFPRPLALHPTTVALLAVGPGGPVGPSPATPEGPDAVARPGRAGGLLAPSRSLGATVAAPTPPAAIVLPRIVAGAPGRLAPLAPPAALLGLLAHAPNLALLGPTAFAVLAGLAARCPAHGLEFDDPAPAARAVVALAPPPAAGVDAVALLPTGEPSAGGGPSRAPDTSAARFGAGDIVVHHRGTGAAHHLNGPAAEVYALCDGRAAAAIVAALTARYPDPSVPHDVEAVLSRLHELGLITSDA
jgi:PqqD family protein of HPr-rel-A system